MTASINNLNKCEAIALIAGSDVAQQNAVLRDY